MWQKEKGKYHLLLNFSESVIDGRFLQTACNDLLQVQRNKQAEWVSDGRCIICEGVWRLICTSVDDAKQTLKDTDDLRVLQRALNLSKSVTLIKAIQARMNRLEREKAA
jgi:hypothetical protein